VSERGEPEPDEGWPAPATPPTIGELLDRVVRGLGSPGADAIESVFAHWPELAGPLAAHARPLALRGDVLVVSVDEPGAATEVRFRQREVLDRLDARIGAGRITRLEAQIRPPG
jgi:predicted nucleic acid-binding Zn ribbon protein